MSPDLSSIAVIIPALNEEESLPHVFAAMPPVGAIFVVDNGSTDSTAAVAARHGVTVLQQPARGYGLACQKGIEAATEGGFEIVVILDEISFDPQMTRLVEPILAGKTDMVLGDRTDNRTWCPHFSALRYRVATGMIRVFSGIITGLGIQSCDHKGTDNHEHAGSELWLDIEMQLKALKNGLRVMEVPSTAATG